MGDFFHFLTEVFEFLGKLVQPGNWPFLVVFTIILLALALVIGAAVLARIKQKDFNKAWRLGPLWIHFVGGEEDPSEQSQGFRKLVYVKVNRLSNRDARPNPFYNRKVDRLDAPEAIVPVFDEAVYYSLKLFPGKRKLGREKEISSGVVDPRLVIPWLTQLDYHAGEAIQVKQMVDIEATAEDNTMLTVSHFLNGLQAGHQDIGSFADEDADSLRLIVDFSSVPNAADFIVLEKTQLLVNRQPVDTDDLKFQQCGDAIYMAHVKNAKKGSLLKMDFTFKDWKNLTGGS